MTKEQNEQELSGHLNRASKYDRKRVETDIEYNLALKQGNTAAALERAYGLIYGAAKNATQHKRLLKKKKKNDAMMKSLEEFL